MKLSEIKQKIAESIILNNIIGFNFTEPVTFESGIKSPVYCDFRKSIAYPKLMELITLGFKELIYPADRNAKWIVCGIATGGVPHAAFLAKELGIPMAYTRPDAQPKDHGLKRLIEGASVKDQNVIVIEDLVTMAGSILKGIEMLRMEGVFAISPFSIFSYDFEQSREEFKKADLELRSILTISDLLPLLKVKLLPKEYQILCEWIKDPVLWTQQRSR